MDRRRTSRVPRPQLQDVETFLGFEGGWVSTARCDGKFVLLLDESALADLLGPDDADLLERLVTVLEFDTEEERAAYVQQRWPDRARHDMRHAQPKRQRPDDVAATKQLSLFDSEDQ